MEPGKEIIIREFNIEDYDQVTDLWIKAPLPYKPEGRDRRDKIEAEQNNENSLFLVAESNGRVIGTVIGTHDGRKGWINRLAVYPEFRRQGIGGKLVTVVEEWLSELGIEIIACLIEDENEISTEVCQKLGYEKFSRISYFTKRRHPGV